jgi:hypothetical protein
LCCGQRWTCRGYHADQKEESRSAGDHQGIENTGFEKECLQLRLDQPQKEKAASDSRDGDEGTEPHES